MRRIHWFIRLLSCPFKYRYSFKLPRHTRIVIYPDGKLTDVLLNYVDKQETQVLAHESHTINIPVVFGMLLGRKWSRFFYLLSYLKCIKPSLVITTTDNDPNFYRIKSYFPQITTIAIQNGSRKNISSDPNGGFFDLLEKLSLDHDLKADIVCTFGTAIQDEYKKYISANFIATGSLKNNYFENTNSEERPNRLAYISGSSSNPPSDPDRIFLYFRDRGITFKEYYNAEATVCTLLQEYCANHNLEFVICGKRNLSNIAETAFYESALKHPRPHVSARESTFDSYELLSTARYAISLDSTLAYEFLSRGKRTAFFSARLNGLGAESLHELAGFRFGYPQPLPQSGPFWSSVLSMSEIERVIGYLKDATDKEWSQVIEPFSTTQMVYDPGNAIIKTLIDTKIQHSSL